MAARSERGQREFNEDDMHYAVQAGLHHAVLADGAGGHVHGALASRRVVACVAEALGDAPALQADLLQAAVVAAHAALQQAQPEASGQQRMHATVVALWIDPAAALALWTHVGDSRLYRLRHGAIDHVTPDDSVVQHMVAAGLLTAAQARDHPQKNQLVAALGMSAPVQPHTLPCPVDIEEGDAYLLCSDGWWDSVGDAAIADTLSNAIGPRDWLDGMHRRIERQGRARQDNYSAIAVWVGDAAVTARLRLD